MDTQTDITRTTIEVPRLLWAKVHIDKLRRGDESLNDVVLRALKIYAELTQFKGSLFAEFDKLDPTLGEAIKKVWNQ